MQEPKWKFSFYLFSDWSGIKIVSGRKISYQKNFLAKQWSGEFKWKNVSWYFIFKESFHFQLHNCISQQISINQPTMSTLSSLKWTRPCFTILVVGSNWCSINVHFTKWLISGKVNTHTNIQKDLNCSIFIGMWLFPPLYVHYVQSESGGSNATWQVKWKPLHFHRSTVVSSYRKKKIPPEKYDNTTTNWQRMLVIII